MPAPGVGLRALVELEHGTTEFFGYDAAIVACFVRCALYFVNNLALLAGTVTRFPERTASQTAPRNAPARMPRAKYLPSLHPAGCRCWGSRAGRNFLLRSSGTLHSRTPCAFHRACRPCPRPVAREQKSRWNCDHATRRIAIHRWQSIPRIEVLPSHDALTRTHCALRSLPGSLKLLRSRSANGRVDQRGDLAKPLLVRANAGKRRTKRAEKNPRL